MLTASLFLLGAACVGLMGFAIQRGATCTVAAMDELVHRHRWSRLVSLAEAALWVAAGLTLAKAFGIDGFQPSGFAFSHWTLIGAVFLGLGAYVNQACVFGAVARLGSGQWAYVLTPPGFFAGCVSLPTLFTVPAALPLPPGAASAGMSLWWLVPCGIWLCWRLVRLLAGITSSWRAGAAPWHLRLGATWSPHLATLVIGATFCVLLLLGGAWAYTDVLAELARGMTRSSAVRMAWLLSLFLGALLGGWSAGLLKSVPVRPGQALRCFAGGMMMGWGSLMIPGSNDGLILVGLPFLWPYAWLAFLAMCLSIAGAMWTGRFLPRLPRALWPQSRGPASPG